MDMLLPVFEDAITILVQVILWTYVFISGSLNSVYLALLDSTKFSKELYHFTSPPTKSGSSSYFRTLPHWVFSIYFFYFIHSLGMKWYPIMILIWFHWRVMTLILLWCSVTILSIPEFFPYSGYTVFTFSATFFPHLIAP